MMENQKIVVANFAGQLGYTKFREVAEINYDKYYLVWNDQPDHIAFVKDTGLKNQPLELIDDAEQVETLIKQWPAKFSAEALLRLQPNAAKEEGFAKPTSSALDTMGKIFLFLSIVCSFVILFGALSAEALNAVTIGAIVGSLLSGLAVWALFKEIAQIAATLRDIRSKF